jgi:hypothetical protein
MKKFASILLGSFVFLTIAKINAQTPGAAQQVDNSHQRRQRAESAEAYLDGSSAPELYPDETSDVGPQTVLKTKPRHHLFEAMADAQYLYTDNAFLTETHRQDSDVLISTVEFALKPTPYDFLGGTLGPSLGYEHQWYNFGLLNHDQVPVFKFGTKPFPPGGPGFEHLDVFNFNSQTAFTGVQWVRGNWNSDIGFDFRRLLSSSDYSEFYKEYVPRWGLQRNFAFGDRAALAIGYAGDYRFAEPTPMKIIVGGGGFAEQINPDMRDRTDHALFATYDQVLCPHTVLQPFFQLKYTRFTDSEIGQRNDLLGSAGLALYWTICRNCDLRAFVDYNARFSDNSQVSEYRQFDGGLGLNVTVRF